MQRSVSVLRDCTTHDMSIGQRVSRYENRGLMVVSLGCLDGLLSFHMLGLLYRTIVSLLRRIMWSNYSIRIST